MKTLSFRQLLVVFVIFAATGCAARVAGDAKPVAVGVVAKDNAIGEAAEWFAPTESFLNR